MKIESLLDLKGLHTIEPTFADLTEDVYTGFILREEGEEARLVVDEQEHPLAFAIRTERGWQIAHFLFRNAIIEVLERFEQIGGDIYQEKREVYLSMVREFYSRELMDRVTPAVEDVTGERISLVREILEERWDERNGEVCLDCCCGSGIGSSALCALGMIPLAYDNDPALLSLGLRQGRLLPESTMWIDATRATRYCPTLHRGTAFMLGEINSYTEEMWKQITHELVALCDEVIITVGTAREAGKVEEWCRKQGRSVTREEHAVDPLYERWICQISR